MPKFHIDLSHVADAAGLKLAIGTQTFDLQRHTTRTQAQARSVHSALMALPEAAIQRFTHFVDIHHTTFPSNEIRWLRVIRPNPDPSIYLPEILLQSLYCPDIHVRNYHDKKLRKNPRYRPAKLAFYGLPEQPRERDAGAAFIAASELVTGLDTAAGLVFHHPELGNVQPFYANQIINEHIAPDPSEDPDQYNAIVALANVITDPNNQPWSPVVACKDQYGNKLQAGYQVGKIKPGDQLYTYGLTDTTTQTAMAPVAGAKRSAYDDTTLQNQTWSVRPGRSALKSQQDIRADGARATPKARAGGGQFDWTVNELTPNHGLSADASSIKIGQDDTFSINVSNSYLRTLYAYYQLLDENGQPTSKKTALQSVSAVNTIMGIPMPTDPATLSFNLAKAPSVQLLFGGFGTSDWDGDVSPRGALLTGLWQYGVPIVFIIAGKALTSTALFNKIVNDKDLLAAALAIAFSIAGGGIPTAAALLNTKSVLFTCADALVGIIAAKGLEKLGAWLIEQVGEGELSNAFGPIGWAIKLIAAGVDFEEMAVTTGEILSSPATIKVKVTRTINVTLTLHPDPAHGEAGHPETAVWPALAQVYLATLQYKDGTTRQLTGAMLPTTNKEPIALDFQAVPAGGQIRVFAGVYSQSGWLAGSWQSDWMPAVANQGDTLALGDQNIKENLVPLSPDTQYVFKESIVYSNGDYVWQATNQPPTATVTSLNPGPNGTLAELVGITINNSAFQVGYAWRASGQNIPPDDPRSPASNQQLFALQNLSVLSDPGNRLKFSQIGFTLQPSIAYSPSVNVKAIDQTNFILDPRGGTSNLRQVTLNGGSGDFGLTSSGLQSWGSFPLTDLDAIAVHPSSQTVVAVSWKEHKMMLLSLPSPDAQAPVAAMVSGEGVRQGLMKGPKALAIAPDGRILVLESLNQRIQAFDTKGNPVPSFIQQPKLFSLKLSDVAADLDAGTMPAALQQALQANAITFLFALASALAAQLDSGTLQPQNDPVIAAFAAGGVVLTYDPNQMNDHQVSCFITVVQAGQSWTITDPGKGLAYQISNQGSSLFVYEIVTKVATHTIQAGLSWTLTDTYTANTWMIRPTFGDPSQVDVLTYVSYAPLYNPQGRNDITYLDMATESQGNIYVLSYVADGGTPADYFLDVYGPDGGFLFRTPNPKQTGTPQNVAAAKIAVDVWRDMYALNYAPLAKPAGARPEPSISHWMPTPPLFSLPLSDQPDFDSRNIGNVMNEFAQHNITLSNNAFIIVNSQAGYYQVKDTNALYDVFRSGDALQVYSIQV